MSQKVVQLLTKKSLNKQKNSSNEQKTINWFS